MVANHTDNQLDIEAAVQAAATRIRALWVCYRHRRPKGWLRFIPAELSRQPSEAPSSSGLRRLMATAANDMLETELEEWALSAGLLATFVRDARKRMERFEQTPAVETHPYDPTKVKW